jgi:Holliday junction DNA helicase RuvA
MTLSTAEIARAIESKDLTVLKKLKGIGSRTAHKIIASLCGKMERFALPIATPDKPAAPVDGESVNSVMDVLVSQLGHKVSDAKRLVAEALERNNAISTPEELFEEVYRGESKT